MTRFRDIGLRITEAHIARWLYAHRAGSVVAMNVYVDGYEADFISVARSGYSHVYEIKVTRSDLQAELRKRARYRGNRLTRIESYLEGRGPNYFTLVVPKGADDGLEIPPQVGIIYWAGEVARVYDETYVRVHCWQERKSTRLHKTRMDAERYAVLARSTGHRLCVLRNQATKQADELILQQLHWEGT